MTLLPALGTFFLLLGCLLHPVPKLTVMCYVVFGRYTWKACFSKGEVDLGERGERETWRKGRGS